jgi:hypothetical protein
MTSVSGTYKELHHKKAINSSIFEAASIATSSGSLAVFYKETAVVETNISIRESSYYHR